MRDSGRIAFLSARHLVDGLVASGVRHFFTSPGFRNSPILAVLAGRPGVVSHIDERGAAFAALGAAKATGSPVAVICTSGTAVGNLLPEKLQNTSHCRHNHVNARRFQRLKKA